MKDKLRVGKLDLAVIGRNHFGNPIPKQWYSAAEELLAILDAEGAIEDVPIGYVAPGSIRGYALGTYRSFVVGDKSEIRTVPLYDTHPARSGVVSDDDVRDAERYRWLLKTVNTDCAYQSLEDKAWYALHNSSAEEITNAIDIAIQGERHER